MRLATELRVFLSGEGVKAEIFNQGKLLESYLVASPFPFPEIPKTIPTPTPIPNPKNLWASLIESIKKSSMTPAMKVACMAQAILESGRGTSNVANTCKNFWGMKMRPELEGLAKGVEVLVTSEVEGKATFASFPDTETSVKGWLKFLTRSYYAGWEDHQNDSEAFLRHIGKSWCPLEGYADKVIGLIPEARELLNLSPTSSTWKAEGLFDPGHSEKEPGARSNKRAEEEDLNRLQAQVAREVIEQYGYTAEIYDPAVDDIEQIGLRAKGKAFFISYHHNSYEGSGDPGHEVFVVRGAKEIDRILAQKICDKLSKVLGTTNRGVKEKNWTVIDAAYGVCKGPVVLVESYFLNPYDPLEASKRSSIAARAIAEALVETLDGN